MRVVAIDPGNRKSAYCVIDAVTLRPKEFGILENEQLQQRLKGLTFSEQDIAAIEMLQSYGNLIGKDILDTAVWIGRFYETLKRKAYIEPQMVFRMEEKIHICNDSRAGDSNIRRALIDRFCSHDFRSGRGTIKNPDWFFGFKADIWAAYAVGLTFIETRLTENYELKGAPS